MTEQEYYEAIRHIPLYYDRESLDPDVAMYRAQDGSPVRVRKPADLTPSQRIAVIEFLTVNYSPRTRN